MRPTNRRSRQPPGLRLSTSAGDSLLAGFVEAQPPAAAARLRVGSNGLKHEADVHHSDFHGGSCGSCLSYVAGPEQRLLIKRRLLYHQGEPSRSNFGLLSRIQFPSWTSGYQRDELLDGFRGPAAGMESRPRGSTQRPTSPL